jgi:hypothetical protein
MTMTEQLQTTEPQTALATTAETSIAAVSAQAVALVQARYTVAYGRPRNIDQVRVGIMTDCKRPRLAEIAMYDKPVGGGIKGLSIRFVEIAMRHMTNVLVESPTVYDDEMKRIVRATVTDLESNTTYQKDITITKTVERKFLKNGQKALSSRLNSYGETTYTLPATDDDILNKEAALVSKAIRTLGLRLIPADIIDEAKDVIEATIRDKAAKDPDGERRKIVDAFNSMGVKPVDLAEYLRHDIAKCTPDEIVHLRMIYATLRDGEATWADVMGTNAEPEEKESKTSATKEILKNRKQSKGKAKKPEPTSGEAAQQDLSSVGPDAMGDIDPQLFEPEPVKGRVE